MLKGLLPPLVLESRWPLELRALRRDPVSAGVGVPHGTGEPVLLVPGYLTGDASMSVMLRWLRRIGYRSWSASMVLNTDCTTAALQRLERRLEAVAGRTRQQVTVIGQSRGGCLARLLATRRPDLVSSIVTLGSPLCDPMAIHLLLRMNVEFLGRLGSLGLPSILTAGCLGGSCCEQVRDEARAPFPPEVGFTSIYSRLDGMVRWRACLDPAAVHVEVRGTHIGMAVQPAVYRVVADALAASALGPVGVGAAALAASAA